MIINSLLKDISVEISDNGRVQNCLDQNQDKIQSFFNSLFLDTTDIAVPDLVLNVNQNIVVEESHESIGLITVQANNDDKSIIVFDQNQKSVLKETPKTNDISTIEKVIILPNARVNQEYKFKFSNNKFGIKDSDELSFENLENIGFQYYPASRELVGIPGTAGEFMINLKIRKEGWTEGKPTIVRVINLTIIADPRSLWKDIATPLDIIYYKPDSVSDFIKIKPSTQWYSFKKTAHKDIVAASIRGRSHAHEGKPRDDDFKLHYNPKNEWYILSVADGAGSVNFSRKGSEIACNTVVIECDKLINNSLKKFEEQINTYYSEPNDLIRKLLGDLIYNIIGTAVFNAYKDIEAESKLSGHPIKEFSTTLIISIAKKFKFGWFIAAYWVGDGGIGIYNKESQVLKVLGEPDSGDYAGQTRFLTMSEMTQPKEIYNRLRFEIIEDFTALILMTDGVSDPKFETDANLNNVNKWNELWEDLNSEVDFQDDNERTANQLLEWLNFWSQGNHDDRTIAILF